jgi:hypothetical protein
MQNLEKAHEKRAEQSLLKPVRIDGGPVTTWKDLIDKKTFTMAKKVDVPAIKYNRRKFNGMNYQEQEEYERRMKETKPEYRLYTDEETFYEVRKTVYDYYEIQRLFGKV